MVIVQKHCQCKGSYKRKKQTHVKKEKTNSCTRKWINIEKYQKPSAPAQKRPDKDNYQKMLKVHKNTAWYRYFTSFACVLQGLVFPLF